MSPLYLLAAASKWVKWRVASNWLGRSMIALGAFDMARRAKAEYGIASNHQEALL